jgi:hypothetical protein
MLVFQALPFYTAVNSIRQLRSAVETGLKSYRSKPNGDVEVVFVEDPILLGFLKNTSLDLAVACRTMGADVTLLVVVEFEEYLGTGQATYETLQKFAEDIDTTLKRELKLVKLLALEKWENELFAQIEPLFGQAVQEKFPIATDDIAEAGNCLALGRGTAAVFHLMRVMEAGLKALGAELGIPYAPSWEAYARQLDTLLDSKNHGSLTPEQRGKRPFYQDVLGDLISVKSAWRNPTMHIVKHYDVQQARRVLQAVEGFMQHLADNLDPLPLQAPILTGQYPV